ncbi:MAG: response regulator transcription factor [Oscillospiraceae bacterium]|nr:response regulator transcription factor [Oscillospiraceae bacterium]
MKLMLVDDHPIFMEGLQYFLQTHGICVLGTAGNGIDALEKARELKPDIILMDIRMPKCDGLGALKLIKAELPEIKIVMLTSYDEDEAVYEAIKCGASGYLMKSINADELLGMLNDISDGNITLSPGIAESILKELKNVKGGNNLNEKSEKKEESLTERQMEILKMVADGVTYKEAGERLGLSERTVKYHMGRIIELLHLANRAQVITYAAQLGLTEK